MSAALKDETRELAGGAGSEEQTSGDAEIFDQRALIGKKIATARARLALQGFAMHELTCGGFLIARWDRTFHAPDLHGVEAFLKRVEG
jgi:hypothetical protein